MQVKCPRCGAVNNVAGAYLEARYKLSIRQDDKTLWAYQSTCGFCGAKFPLPAHEDYRPEVVADVPT